MNKIWIITKRELGAYFNSLMAYLMIIAFLLLSGIFTWFFGSDVFFRKQADLLAFFNIAQWTLFFFIPALTMRLLAEENRSGTIELLLTRPINDWQIIMGKFLATLILVTTALLLTFPYYITIAKIGTVDHGTIIAGYIGLIFLSAFYIGIGVFTSSISNNQIIGFLLALFIGIFFQLIFGFVANNFSGFISHILSYLSVTAHVESISRGVLDSKDIIYFLSFVLLSLFSTQAVMAKKRL